ncbi:hypothetical protein BUALT_Bualt11G0089100 [Buddleja alternifolia]|uniref:Uncharacterized protein n=1 Tax=Buddleja alternifolia TaxID=168488 RepID=A0AAV6X497_9LAMI|nr:hypothetical protein BUALT_Bualt11G0089100 [Buddleja alternifolia]
MESRMRSNFSPTKPTWRKVAYGGMQFGFDDNHTNDSFLEDVIMNANVVKRDLVKVMLDSVSISQYLCIVALVVLAWTYTLRSTFSERSPVLLDFVLLGAGFFIVLLTAEMLSFDILLNYVLKILFFMTVASILIASRLPLRLHVFAIVLFLLQVFLFAQLVSYWMKKYSFRLHLCFSLGLMSVTLFYVYRLH